MSKVQHYLSMIVFVSAVMLGVQIPNFVDQYVKRVDAHYLEASTNFAQYQQTADQYFNGSIEKLIGRYSTDSDPSVKAAGDAVRFSRERLYHFKEQREELQQDLWRQIFYIMFQGDSRVRNEVVNNYTAALPFSLEAGICGIGLGILAAIIWEFLVGLLKALLGGTRRRVHAH